MILTAQKAPNFTASALLPNGKIIHDFNMLKYAKKKYILLFFWPLDFTFVCPSELLEFNTLYEEFEKRNVCLIGISIDSVYTHHAWVHTDLKNGGIGLMKYPLISDLTRNIQSIYGIEHPNLGISLRSSFLIDRDHIVRHQSVNDLPIGRNIHEILRIIDALQFHEKNGEVCPANWTSGKKGIIASPEGIRNYLTQKYKNHIKK
ncbi:peroxiredoxin [Buchnera aphidicola]|uniref:Thioredoxin peroxidase n=1 Tax=Buchnera aphidicola subsp. Tuberolachnus salignus TaxID=98804 RepID=A0A160SVV1_BUCTT|nr:peroxiredoxin [Buchnera aphidicola]CUR53107.1 Alkyl hydroperoxide reductase subunit C [Buchnera aphidicola (Tuberolachnus salignus)]